MTHVELVEAILTGRFDDHIEHLYDAVRERKRIRRDIAARVQFHTLGVGDKVKLVNLRPLYLVGLTGTIASKNRTRISVRLDTPVRRYGSTVNCKPEMLEAV